MFRRKEESLFDNELAEETESFTVVQSQAPAAPAAVTQAATTVAQPAASAQPITRPATLAAAPVVPSAPVAGAPAAPSFRPAATPAAANNASASISRPTESKTMHPTATSFSSSNSNSKASNRVLTVGNDILLKGEITTCDRLVIEGKVEATISDVNTVELAECGSFKGSANVVDAQISGLFEGDLVVTGRLVIYASGKVRGNISYGEIEIERGGELSGTIKSVGVASVPKALNKVAA